MLVHAAWVSLYSWVAPTWLAQWVGTVLSAFNALSCIVKIFLIMYKYTFGAFGHRTGAFRASGFFLYARRGYRGGENGKFQAQLLFLGICILLRV